MGRWFGTLKDYAFWIVMGIYMIIVVIFWGKV